MDVESEWEALCELARQRSESPVANDSFARIIAREIEEFVGRKPPCCVADLFMARNLLLSVVASAEAIRVADFATQLDPYCASDVLAAVEQFCGLPVCRRKPAILVAEVRRIANGAWLPRVPEGETSFGGCAGCR